MMRDGPLHRGRLRQAGSEPPPDGVRWVELHDCLTPADSVFYEDMRLRCAVKAGPS